MRGMDLALATASIANLAAYAAAPTAAPTASGVVWGEREDRGVNAAPSVGAMRASTSLWSRAGGEEGGERVGRGAEFRRAGQTRRPSACPALSAARRRARTHAQALARTMKVVRARGGERQHDEKETPARRVCCFLFPSRPHTSLLFVAPAMSDVPDVPSLVEEGA